MTEIRSGHHQPDIYDTRFRWMSATRGGSYSHSIIFGYRNPLNSKRKFFLLTAKLRRPIRQKFQLLI